MDILIIEKEARAVERLTALLKEFNPPNQVLGNLDSIEAVLQWFENRPVPDLVFLNLRLKEGNAFGIFNHSGSVNKNI